MSTLGTMKTRIADELKRADLTSQIHNAIISSLAYYKRRPMNWNRTRATLSCTPNTEYYQLPSDFIEVDTLILRSGGSELDWLEGRSHHWIDQEKSWDGYRSRPAVYSVQSYELRLYPVPDQSYTLLMSYVYELPEVSASASDTASNEWMIEGEELIRLHAKVDVLMNIIRGPEAISEAQTLVSREAAVFKQLDKQRKRAESSGRLTPY